MPQIATDLADEVGRRIDLSEPCWFPGLAPRLVRAFWAESGELEPDGYSTEAWLGGLQPVSRTPVPGYDGMAVEALPPVFRSRFEPLEAPAAEAAPAISRAMARLLPMRAGEAAANLVRSVHCVIARGPGYDCSHSEPTIPFSIFLSLPLGERDAELRLAESLLHEAMHLQLTLIERRAPIVGGNRGFAWSPWQQCDRPIQGLVHGLYVFAAIHCWLRCLAQDPSLSAEDRTYVDRRLREIEAEVATVEALESEPCLTEFGRRLSIWLLAPFRVSPAAIPRPRCPA